MGTVSFTYSFNHVLKATMRSLRKKGFRIVDINKEQTEITARKKFQLVHRDTLHISIAEKDADENILLKLESNAKDSLKSESIFLDELYKNI